MYVDIPYGKEKIKVDIPEPCEILVPNKVIIKDQNEIIEKALKNPIGKPSFESFIEESERLLVIVNDASKPTPTSIILKHLYTALSAHPNVVFLVATGAHRPPADEEYRYIFGRFYNVFKDQIYTHNARKNEDMAYRGKSKKGTEIYINKMVPEIGNVLVIGSVEPHYFAGCTGGRKSFLPGVASYKTIEMNHRFALSDKARSFAFEGNPVHEDMIDAMNALHDVNVFSIQAVLTHDHKIYTVTAGDLFKSFDVAKEHAKQIFCVPLKEKGNIVLTVAPYPMDIDLYQSQNALENGRLALEDHGIIILVSKCRMGVGNDAFLDLLSKANTPQELLDILSDNYKFGCHKAARIAKIRTQAQIWAVTDIDDEIVKKALLKPYPDIQSAVDDAEKNIRANDKQPRIVVMPSGSLTIPYIEN